MLHLRLLQVVFSVVFFGFGPLALATEGASACFDFSKKVADPLRTAPAWKSDRREDVSGRGKVTRHEPGKPKSGYVWGQARGVVRKPIRELLNLLLDHNTTKSSKIREINFSKSSDENYFARHVITFEVTALIFFSAEWTEEWGYAITRGSGMAPERVVISYQKTAGTSHIEHLCGSIVLEMIDANTTDVYAYEEVNANQRNDEDTESGLVGTLLTLRK